MLLLLPCLFHVFIVSLKQLLVPVCKERASLILGRIEFGSGTDTAVPVSHVALWEKLVTCRDTK